MLEKIIMSKLPCCRKVLMSSRHNKSLVVEETVLKNILKSVKKLKLK